MPTSQILPMVESSTNVSRKEVLERLSSPLVGLERPLGNLAYRLRLTGDGVSEEGQTLTAEVSHGDTGGGHEPHEEVEKVMGSCGSEVFHAASGKVAGHLGG